MDAAHGPAEPSVVALFERDAARSDALAAALRADGWTVLFPTDGDTLPDACVVLFAPDRTQPGTLRGVVTRLRGNVPSRQVMVVSAVGPHAGGVDSRDALATAQAAGCDGCLLYAHPAEVASVLRACGVSPCV